VSRRFRGEVLRLELAPGKYHNHVVVHTRDAREIRRFSFQAPSSGDLFKNANRANEVQSGANTDDSREPLAIYRLAGTLATDDTAPLANWHTIDAIIINTTSDGRDRIYSTSDVFLNSGPYRHIRFDMTYYPVSSQDAPILLVLEESETRD